VKLSGCTTLANNRVVTRPSTARFALLLALVLGGNLVSDVGDDCVGEDDASLVDACTLCPCCATSMTSPLVALVAVAAVPAERVLAPVLPIGSLDAPAPATPPPIHS
jgi:hypothetical protein